ncbi:Lysozyme RrrD [compost metagenome]
MSLPRGLKLPLAGSALAIASALLAFFEGDRLVPYLDSGGVPTDCRGNTDGVRMGVTRTQAECDAINQRNLLRVTTGVDRLITAPVTVPCRAALYDFAYNAGLGNLRGSTLLRRLNAGDQHGAAAEFDRWVYVRGRDCRLPGSNCAGIVTRRSVERWLCEV